MKDLSNLIISFLFLLSFSLSLGLAYAGGQREEVMELLTPVIANIETPIDVFAMASLALGMVYVGTCKDTIAETIMQGLLERDEKQLSDTLTRFASLGLGLLFLGRQDQAEMTLEALKVIAFFIYFFCKKKILF